jgi:hypothetical protein
MSDVPVSWKKITRGLPKVRSFANDRAPKIEEIRKMTEYPDRRMKSIVFTMASSGIGLTLKLGYVTTNTSLFIELLALLETPNPKNLHLFNIILVNIIK